SLVTPAGQSAAETVTLYRTGRPLGPRSHALARSAPASTLTLARSSPASGVLAASRDTATPGPGRRVPRFAETRPAACYPTVAEYADDPLRPAKHPPEPDLAVVECVWLVRTRRAMRQARNRSVMSAIAAF